MRLKALLAATSQGATWAAAAVTSDACDGTSQLIFAGLGRRPTGIHDILDTNRYPIHLPHSDDYSKLVNGCQAALARDGMFSLEGFVQLDAIKHAAHEVAPLIEAVSFFQSRSHNVYFLDEVPGVSSDHPALRPLVTSSRTLCDDQLGGSIVHAIYEWQPLARFLADVIHGGKRHLYLMDDPLARVNVMAYRDGDALGWHFDRSEFTTTLLVQSPLAGGEFQYRSNLRTEKDPNLSGIGRVLDGQDPEQKSLRLSPGTLNVFRGKDTLHGVSEVRGDYERIIAVFSYFDRPGVVFSDAERLGFYGRTGSQSP